jgi:FKBP-type peptidyl-prolyl cis-trans isomerase FkpA
MKFLVGVVLVAAFAVSGCGGNDGGGGSPTAPSANVPFSTVDVRVGTGAEATTGRSATVNYALYLYSATAAENKGTALQAGSLPPFVVGSNQVIPGFSQATLGMRVGGFRRAVIPPNLAYGAQGSPPLIPGNATLVFEIELLAVQ